MVMVSLLRGALDGAHDARIGAAAADVAVHVRDDLLARRLLVLREQRRRLHDLAGLAVAALRHLLGDPRLLQRMAAVGDRPSMVVTFLPATAEIGVTQERTGLPSTCTVQAPHCADAAAELRAGQARVLRARPTAAACRLGCSE